ncbi:dTMP kinase [Candidatus Peribacteria bacterium]|jgi:dTMP kinase|nr:dTMP kinase [Candidatus Peribacteria bacterium]MBT4021253.1 dTMP kinase [Candidatus Peribacteria bacterium]MBT4240682.1 dTMP kinase [Candidatus Peribacteria bacterium]MBT4474027.1 dTMP kinase [Candidatus Peribacteria bacterium]
MKGAFIVFEGPDGSGTSTQVRMFCEKLQEEGKDVVNTYEPTDGKYGKQIRGELGNGITLSPMELQQLYCEDRSEHVGNIIFPALKEGKTVVTDRYSLSTIIYGEASGVSKALLESWNEGFPVPDCIVVTLPPFDVCLERVGRRDEKDAFEKEEFMRKVYAGYEKYVKENPDVCVIDTSGDKEDSRKNVYDMVTSCLQKYSTEK